MRPPNFDDSDTVMLNAPPHQSQLPVSSAPAARPPSLRLPALVLVLVALLYLGASAGPALFDQNEGQYAGAAREMLNRAQDYIPATRESLERGHWYIPTNDGIPRLQKPPAVYWMLMGSMRVFGVNAVGARLPNAVFSLLWFWAVFLLGRRLGGTALAMAGTTILATMTGTFLFSHLVAPEPFFTAFLTLTFWSFMGAYQQPRLAGPWMFLAWVFMGLGACSKGLHAAVYPCAVAGLLAWRHPETRPIWRKLLSPAGLAAFLAILLPWYAVIAARYPGFLHDQLINEQLGHVLNRRFPPDSNRVPFIVFCLEHLVFFLPWTFFIPAAIAARRDTASEPRMDVIGWDLLICWFGVTLVSLLFSSLQDYYLMGAWTPVAFWLARPWASPAAGRNLRTWMRLGPGVCLALIGVAMLAAAVYLGSHAAAAATGRAAAPTAVRDTIAATLNGFSAAAWRKLLPLVWAAGGTILTGGALSAWLAADGRWRSVLPATAVMMVAVLSIEWCGLRVLEDYFSLKRVALTANRVAGPDGEVVCSGAPEDNPSLLFYLNRENEWVGADPRGTFASRQLGIGRDLFLTDEDFARRWDSARNVLLITEADDMPRWKARLGLTTKQAQPIAESGTRVLLINHPASR
jgi:4-amino-4-deoxy-L-arabinose transferase-like glycosyltransferase